VAHYGCEHIRMAPHLVQALQRSAVRCGTVRPFGTPALVTLLAYPTGYDPGYKVVAQPLLRWARELWLQAHPTAHTDRLTPAELRAAQRLFSHTPVAELPQGPLAAIAGALDLLQWTSVLPESVGPRDCPRA
jgi:hypothetical protein